MSQIFYYTGLIMWGAAALTLVIYLIPILGEITRKTWMRTYPSQWFDYRRFEREICTNPFSIHNLEMLQRIYSHPRYEAKIFLYKVHQLIREAITMAKIEIETA